MVGMCRGRCSCWRSCQGHLRPLSCPSESQHEVPHHGVSDYICTGMTELWWEVEQGQAAAASSRQAHAPADTVGLWQC